MPTVQISYVSMVHLIKKAKELGTTIKDYLDSLVAADIVEDEKEEKSDEESEEEELEEESEED